MAATGITETFESSLHETYKLIYELSGPWVGEDGRNCRLVAINLYGETKWGVLPETKSESDQEAVAHFNLTPWLEAGAINRRHGDERRAGGRRQRERRVAERGESDRRQYDRRQGGRRKTDGDGSGAEHGAPQRFSYTHSTTDDGFEVIAPQGDLDFNNSGDLRTVLLELVEQQSNVLVDMTAVPYMDSSGIASLIEVFQTAGKRNMKFGLFGIAGPVQRVLKVAHLDNVLPIFDTIAEATADLG